MNKSDAIESSPGKPGVVLQWKQWIAEARRTDPARRAQHVTVVLHTSIPVDHPELVTLAYADTIIIEVDIFTDGRVFGLARILRSRIGFRGRLRVRGDILPDQHLFLRRVGVDLFAEEQEPGPDLYSEYYQPHDSLSNRSIRQARLSKKTDLFGNFKRVLKHDH